MGINLLVSSLELIVGTSSVTDLALRKGLLLLAVIVGFIILLSFILTRLIKIFYLYFYSQK